MRQNKQKFEIKPQALSVNEAAAYINRSSKTIRRMMDRGELAFTVISRSKMIAVAELNKLINPNAL